MKRSIRQFGIIVLVGTACCNAAFADEPHTSPLRRLFQRNECETCDVESTSGAFQRAKMNREYGPPVTVRYPVAVPGHEVISPTPNAIRRPWNRRGYGCWAHRDSPGSPSTRSTLRFIFGSSRSFFGEPCIPEPSLAERGYHR